MQVLLCGADGQALYETIDDEVLKDEFKKDDSTYVATGLTFGRLDELREEKAAREGKLGAAASASGVRVLTNSAEPQRPWTRQL